MVLVEVKHLTKLYTEGDSFVHVLNDISVIFEQGRTYAITGVSGAGKSTLLHLIAALDKPDTGKVYYNQHDIALFSRQDLDYFHNKEIGLIFQQPYLIRELSVIENVMLPGLIGGMDCKSCQERALSLLGHVGLARKTNEKPPTLSGGQQQRVALARALFNKPAFLCADEPTGNLDEKTGKDILALLLKCQQEWKMGLIISSHDKWIIQAMQEIYQLRNGALSKIMSGALEGF